VIHFVLFNLTQRRKGAAIPQWALYYLYFEEPLVAPQADEFYASLHETYIHGLL